LDVVLLVWNYNLIRRLPAAELTRSSIFTLQNERLRDEQFLHVKTLLRQAKEQELELEQRQVYNSEHVEQALKEKWEAARVEEEVLDGASASAAFVLK